VFDRLLPDDRDTLFLHACLHEGEHAARAWRNWLESATADGTPARRALAPVNALLPLLAWNLRRAGAGLDRAVQTHLRSALLTEDLRWQRYRDICGEAFGLLARADIPFLVLKGAAVGERFYPQPMLRHADDIDVLLHPADIPRASALFRHEGWTEDLRPVFSQPLHAPPLVDASGVCVEFHSRLLIPHFTLPYERLWARAESRRVAGVQVQMLAPADALLHTIGHAMQSATDLRWVADAWFMLQSSECDWRRFTTTVMEARLALPVHAALSYLDQRMDMDVPVEVLQALGDAALRATYADRQASRPWPIGRAFPPPVQFALHYDVPLWSVPYYYVVRLAQAFHARRRVRRHGVARTMGPSASPTV
jgi:hypothetical protein